MRTLDKRIALNRRRFLQATGGTAVGGASCTSGVDYIDIFPIDVTLSPGEEFYHIPLEICMLRFCISDKISQTSS